MTVVRSCTVVFVGVGNPAALAPRARRAIRGADTLVSWVEPPDGLVDRPVVRLATPSRRSWKARLLGLGTGDLTYLAPGYGADDDPGAAIVSEVLADTGCEVDVLGLDGPQAPGPALIGPAAQAWLPDPALAAVVRGIRDAAELERWRQTIAREFGHAAQLRLRPWSSTTWQDLDDRPAEFPLTLRAEPTEASRERSVTRLREVFETLRGPEGCPWDRAQTHASLRKYVLEEAAEVVDAIDDGEPSDLAGELGDLLANIVLHAEIARQAENFAWPDVVQGVTAKMVRRHPHVFGEQTAHEISEVAAIWQHAKRAEAARDGQAIRDGALPALAQAAKLSAILDGRAATDGLPPGATAAIRWYRNSEIAADDARAGDALLGLALDAKSVGIDPELALRDALRRTRSRLAAIKSTQADGSSAENIYVK
ncbi:MAG: hypothetical protein OXG33_14500 [Chloroflexi bacterium]|nr:hypothetical protein [Chloroflexota bacterium]